jgi:hypothetical protein
MLKDATTGGAGNSDLLIRFLYVLFLAVRAKEEEIKPGI